MFRFAAVRGHPVGGPHFEVRRTAAAEAAADAALGAAWLLLWLVFVLALAPAVPSPGVDPASGAGPERAAAGATPGELARPAAGPSARGVAPARAGGAG